MPAAQVPPGCGLQVHDRQSTHQPIPCVMCVHKLLMMVFQHGYHGGGHVQHRCVDSIIMSQMCFCIRHSGSQDLSVKRCGLQPEAHVPDAESTNTEKNTCREVDPVPTHARARQLSCWQGDIWQGVHGIGPADLQHCRCQASEGRPGLYT